MNYTPVIGLEIHSHLKVKTGMFCRCATDIYNTDPNTRTCPVCLGLPGALPVPNKEAIKKTHLIGVALNCELKKESQFDRKNYFYPDLPKGYQISQYEHPLCGKGYLKIEGKKIGITRVHLEEDTGKSVHVGQETLLDFNKSGAALVEIVTDPDMTSVKEAVEFSKEIRKILKYLNTSDADMEKGQLRLEANISLRKEGETELPSYKVEVKNINSFKFLEKALLYEIARQAEVLDSGKQPVQENRGWDEIRQKTQEQREKEEASDYRYFPEPDIPPMSFTDGYFSGIKKLLPELPLEKQSRYVKALGLSEDFARIICEEPELAELFEGATKTLPAKDVANKLVNNIALRSLTLEKLLEKLVETDQKEILDEGEFSTIIKKVLETEPKAVADVKAGKENAVSFLMGKVMRERGGLDPQEVKKLIVKIINES